MHIHHKRVRLFFFYLSCLLSLIKPGIVGGNFITAAAGFFAISLRSGNVSGWLFFWTMLGISSVVASGCVINNCIDQDIDALMFRTKNRVMVKKHLPLRVALFYGIVLVLLGSSVLILKTNALTFSITFFGWIVYVIFYSLWLKRCSPFGTLIGAISGAIPPVAGYCAVAGHFDLEASLLFFILFSWQIAHFLSISMYRYKDYLAASIPVLPIRKGMLYTKINIIIYTVIFFISSICMTFFGYSGAIYLFVISFIGILWIGFGLKNTSGGVHNDKIWSHRMFKLSIVSIMAFCFFVPLQ